MFKGRKEAREQKEIGHDLTDYARSLISVELQRSKAFAFDYFGLDDDEHQFKIVDQYGFEYESRVRETERCTALAGDRSSFAYHAVTFVSAFLPSSVWLY